jgi:hypothetical protein
VVSRFPGGYRRGTRSVAPAYRYQVFAKADGPAPDGLVVTVNSPDERDPPATERFPIDTDTGEVELTTPVDPSHKYDLFASAATPDELASESVRVDLESQTSEG